LAFAIGSHFSESFGCFQIFFPVGYDQIIGIVSFISLDKGDGDETCKHKASLNT